MSGIGEIVGVVSVVATVWSLLRVNKLGVMVGAEEDVLENDDALCVLMGDDSRDDTEGGRGDERADA